MTDNAQLIEEMRWQLKQIEDRKAIVASYALTPNPAALRYELAPGAPQTAFTGHSVVAHNRGYTVQKNDRVYEFMRFAGRLGT